MHAPFFSMKMIAIRNCYYASRTIPAGESFEVESEGHALSFEKIGWARRIDSTEIGAESVTPMTTEEASPIVKRGRGRPRKNPILEIR